MKKNIMVMLVSVFLSINLIGCSSTRVSSKSLNHILSGNRYAEKGDFKRSAAEYRMALKEEPNSFTAKRNLGLVSVKLGLYRESIRLLDEVSTFYPKDSELYYFLGEAQRGLGQDLAAISSYQKALSISPNELRVLKSLSWVLYKNGNYDRAENLIQTSFQKNPFDLQLLLIMTSIDLKKDRYAKAIRSLQDFEKSDFKVVSKDQKTAETERILLLNVLGNAYAGLNNCEKAQKIYAIVLKSRPFLASTLTDSAKCDLKFKNAMQAKEKLEKAHAAEPNYPEALFLLGSIYRANDPQRAAFYYKRFMKLSSDSKEFSLESKQAQAALQQLESKKLISPKKSD